MKITDKTVAIVTGGASGLGAAVAQELASQGAKVTIFDMNADLGTAMAEQIGGGFQSVDVSDPASVGKGLDAVKTQHDQLRGHRTGGQDRFAR